MRGDDGRNTLMGGAGNDLIHGGDGDDYINGNQDNDVIYGDDGNDWICGGIGDDTLYGGQGADTLVFNGGADIIDNTGHAADGDTLLLSVSAGTDQLWFQQAANDLRISVIGTTTSVTVSNWFADSANHVSTIQSANGRVLTDIAVQNLVDAMAGMAPPAIGQTTLTTDQHQHLDTVIAANWR